MRVWKMTLRRTKSTIISIISWHGSFLRFHQIRTSSVSLYTWTDLSHLMRLWHFSSSVNSFLKRACTAMHSHPVGLDVWFLVEPFAYVISTTISWAGSFGPRQTNLVLIAYASSEGSGEPAHPRSLARTFAARSYKQWVKRNLQTESQIPGPSEWLGMRS